METKHPTLVFIGAGHMGSSLMHGLVRDGYPATCIWACDHEVAHLKTLQQKLGVQISDTNQTAVQHADVVVFAVKPQDMARAVNEIKETLRSNMPLLISIAAGVRTESFKQWLGMPAIAMVRAMPNTPALVGSGASALYATGQTTEEQRTLAESILRAVGISLWVDHEANLDVVTALSGSGPAYFFYMMEILAEAAQDMGLNKEVARLLTVQTCLGAARLALGQPGDLSALRAQVTSKGGTTERALATLKEGGFKQLLENALAAAKLRAKELGDMLQ